MDTIANDEIKSINQSIERFLLLIRIANRIEKEKIELTEITGLSEFERHNVLLGSIAPS